ncbi:MAG: hypothetical protein WC895_04845, partial [Candidatus Shapirobacteria bacterium]
MKLSEFATKVAHCFQVSEDPASLASYVSALKLAGFENDISNSFNSEGVDIVLAAAKHRKPGISPSKVRTASVKKAKCPKCNASMV